MSQLAEVLKELHLTQDQITELVTAIRTNPMAAMGVVQKLNIPADFFQKVMGIIMTNPNAIGELAAEVGISKDTVDQVKNQMQGALGGIFPKSSEEPSSKS